MWGKNLLGLILSLWSLSKACESARILCIFPMTSISHQVVYRGLTLALQRRGHELVIATPNPINDATLTNYTEIDMHFLYEDFSTPNFTAMRENTEWYDVLSLFGPVLEKHAINALSMPEMKRLRDPGNGERFDLVIIETFFAHAFYPFVKRYDVPWIGVLSLGLGLSSQYNLGNPLMPSYIGNWEMGKVVGEDITFWKRLKDYIDLWRYFRCFHDNITVKMEKIAEQFFGDYGSTIMEIEKNVSLILTYQQTPISFVRPTVPKIIPVGGYHISKQPQSLPEELKHFLDGATDGFVFMSLGSNARSSMLSNKTLDTLITVFSKIPYRVLWKFEDDFHLKKLKNVRTMKWIPQQAVLAHPNIKVFIYQGGLQSTEEAISYAVPLIGLPVLADQDGQVMKMVSLGVAKKLEILDLNADDLVKYIREVATDYGYKQRMLNLRALVNDRPYDPLDHAVWWVEHVIRHKGTQYLHSSTADLPWYQRGDIDLVAFITATSLILSLISLLIFYRVVIYVSNVLCGRKKLKTH